MYRKLNIENDIVEQGFLEHTYDVVIASNVLHATQSLETTLKNTRSLLKPGGYLVMLEVTATDWLRTGFMFCGFADWWAGRNDGRQYTPTVTQNRWDELFKNTGYSGIDSAVGPRDYMTPYSVMITQAVDAQMSLIRQPLHQPGKRAPIEDVLILGGQTLCTFDLIEDIVATLQPFATNIRVLSKLEEINEASLNNETLILCLTELDENVFNPFTPEKYSALQRLTEKVQNVLWVTQGALGERPYANMMHGVARCLLHERSDSRFQIIDLDVSRQPNVEYIAQTLMRLHISCSWSKFSTPYTPHWSFEREIYVDKDGYTRIARYRQSIKLDNRYNCSRRLVRTPLKLTEAIVEITSRGSYELCEHTSEEAEPEKSKKDVLSIRLKRSFLKSFKLTDIGFLYLAIGTETSTGKKVLALTNTLRSEIMIPQSSAVDCDVPEDQELAFLVIIANELVADSIQGLAVGNGQVLVHEPTKMLASTIKRQTEMKGTSVAMTSTKSQNPFTKFVHASIPARDIQAVIPKTTSAFVSLVDDLRHDDFSCKARGQLPSKCKTYPASAIFGQESDISDCFTTLDISSTLATCYNRAVIQLSGFTLPGSIVELELSALSGYSTKHDPLTVVNWTATQTSPVKVFPPENYTRFRSDRSYFLVGMTGELGTSLCHWMIARGARYIALTSRSPKVSKRWLAAMEALGATVKVFSM